VVLFDLQHPARSRRHLLRQGFLIKQVVEELRRETPKLDTFVTLSPVARLHAMGEAGQGFCRCLTRTREILKRLDDPKLA